MEGGGLEESVSEIGEVGGEEEQDRGIVDYERNEAFELLFYGGLLAQTDEGKQKKRVLVLENLDGHRSGQ